MKIVLIIAFLLQAANSLSQSKQVCFSYDDLPVVGYGVEDPAFRQNILSRLIKSLKQNKVPAIGFVNEAKLYGQSGIMNDQINMLRQWIESGLELGNHTFSHLDYNTTTLTEYTQDILKGEQFSRQLLAKANMDLKYFRHPFLHIGNSKDKFDSLNMFLSEHNYITAPVTIDNEDYVFALAYEKARVKGNSSLMKQIGADYLIYMEEKLVYYENQAQSLFGRNISQIVLLHANLLNADYAHSLIQVFRKNKYDFVSMDQALKDDAYKTKITVFGKWGISWIDRWAMSRGEKGDFFKGEPRTPDYIVSLARAKN
jgi:peptidoglycan/xylan/chitin deacetylase (PgdA/CDA1 family)